MAEADSKPELTSTLHLGLRPVVGDSPSELIKDYLASSSAEERAVLESTLAGDGKSAMVLIHRGPGRGARFLVTSDGATIGRSAESAIFLDDVTVSRKHAALKNQILGSSSKILEVSMAHISITSQLPRSSLLWEMRFRSVSSIFYLLQHKSKKFHKTIQDLLGEKSVERSSTGLLKYW